MKLTESKLREIIQEEINSLNEATPVPKYGAVTVRLVDYTNGKNRSKKYSNEFPVLKKFENPKEFKAWLKKKYPKAVEHTGPATEKKFGKDWIRNYMYLTVRISDPHSNGWDESFIIPN